MSFNNYIIKISEEKYRYFRCNFDEKKKKSSYADTFEGNWYFIESLIFFFFFFFSHLPKIWHAKCKVLPFNRKNIFYRNLHHLIQGRLSLLISKSVWHNFPETYAKINVFLSTMIRLWRTLTSLWTAISGDSLRRLFFVIINSALMPPWLVENSKKK